MSAKLEFIDLKTQYAALRDRIDAAHAGGARPWPVHHGPRGQGAGRASSPHTPARRHCITVASGTEALLIALMALDLKPGDEVITTPFTFAATAEMIVLLGGKPVFVDIEPDTCNIDAALHRSEDHAAHTRDHAGQPVRPGGRHGRDQRHRGAPRPHPGDRGCRAELRRHLQGPQERQPVDLRLHQLLPEQAAGLLRRRRRASSPTTTRWPRPAARSACTARARATRTRASASAGAWTRCSARSCSPSWSASSGSCSAGARSARATTQLLAGAASRSCWRCGPTATACGRSTRCSSTIARACRRRCRRRAFRPPCTTRGRCTTSRPTPRFAAPSPARNSVAVAQRVMSLPMSADLSSDQQDRVTAQLRALLAQPAVA